MASDFHTHTLPAAAGRRALVSAADPDAAPLVSLEFHPWRIPDDFTALPADFAARLRRCAALGEIGLDRLHPPEFAAQRRAFAAAVDAGAALRKPLVIHAVRATDEVRRITEGYPAPRLIHGFRGAVRRLAAWLDAGFFVSLHPAALGDDALGEFLRRRGFARIGVESDDLPDFDLDTAVAEAEAHWRLPGFGAALDDNFDLFLNLETAP